MEDWWEKTIVGEIVQENGHFAFVSTMPSPSPWLWTKHGVTKNDHALKTLIHSPLKKTPALLPRHANEHSEIKEVLFTFSWKFNALYFVTFFSDRVRMLRRDTKRKLWGKRRKVRVRRAHKKPHAKPVAPRVHIAHASRGKRLWTVKHTYQNYTVSAVPVSFGYRRELRLGKKKEEDNFGIFTHQ